MVMHARKTQRLNDGYFEKHQTHPYQSSKYSSKRDYERDPPSGGRSSSSQYMRDRDQSPNGGPALGNGVGLGTGSAQQSSYHRRSVTPDLDSPRDLRDRDRDRYASSSAGYGTMHKLKERGGERDRDYKKDKYTDKRERRSERDEHRSTNHDRLGGDRRSSKMCSDKRSGSDDRAMMARSMERERDRNDRNDRGDRDRDRDRDRDHRERSGGGGSIIVERDRDRMPRADRFGDWTEHVSSSGKKYYYNSKTEVSQWDKPKEWLDKESMISSGSNSRNVKEAHREYRDKDRDRERDERFSRSSYKHSSTRESSRHRWPHDPDGPQSGSTANVSTAGGSSHRRRNELSGGGGNPIAGDHQQDMDISPGDSTPTSESSYAHSGTPTTLGQSGAPSTHNHGNDALLSGALPRLSAHSGQPSAGGVGSLSSKLAAAAAAAAASSAAKAGVDRGGPGDASPLRTASPGHNHNHQTNHHHHNHQNHTRDHHSSSALNASSNNSVGLTHNNHGANHDYHSAAQQMNANAPGPPSLSSSSHQHLLSAAAVSSQSKHSSAALGNKSSGPGDHQPHHHHHHHHHGGDSNKPGNSVAVSSSSAVSALNSHQQPHGGGASAHHHNHHTQNHRHAMMAPDMSGHHQQQQHHHHQHHHQQQHHHHNSTAASTMPTTTLSAAALANHNLHHQQLQMQAAAQMNSANALAGGMTTAQLYSMPAALLSHSTALPSPPTHQPSVGVGSTMNCSQLGHGISSQFSAAGLKSDGTSSKPSGNNGNANDGPPTPTQDFDQSEHRNKHDGGSHAGIASAGGQSSAVGSSGGNAGQSTASGTLSSLQSVVNSAQTVRCSGPNLTPSLANYYNEALIGHVNSWFSESYQRQLAQKCADDIHMYGDIQCTKVSSELKVVRGMVRISEITATLQEQKVMYLRQQIRRLEELKSQNSFMSEEDV